MSDNPYQWTKCPTCNGVGTITEDRPWPIGPKVVEIERQCTACNGTGQVRAQDRKCNRCGKDAELKTLSVGIRGSDTHGLTADLCEACMGFIFNVVAENLMQEVPMP